MQKIDLDSFKVEGKWHFMTTLTKTIINPDHVVKVHKSIMVISEKKFFTQESFIEYATQAIKADPNRLYDLSYLNLEQGSWEIDGINPINDLSNLNWIREECSYTLLHL